MGRFREFMSIWLGGKKRDVECGSRNVEWGTEIEGFRAWYCGDEAGLQAFYENGDDGIGNTRFWAGRGSNGISFRKIHSGLPALMVDTLADIVCDDLLCVKVGECGLLRPARNDGLGERNNGRTDRQKVWERICEENGFEGLIRRAVREVLVCGDGAFKVNVDTDLSDLPVIEFVGGDRVEYEYRRGRICEVRFRTEIERAGFSPPAPRGGSPLGEPRNPRTRSYTLVERYGFGYVKYELYDERGRPVELSELEATAGLEDVSFERKMMMAVPFRFDESGRVAGRGKSLFDGKTGLFDGLDEVVSMWVDCLRTGRPNVYIPAVLLPRNPHTGEIMRSNAFDGRFIQTQRDLSEGAENRIEVVQPDIQTDALFESYITFLDLCLQGVMSPSTIGAEISKNRDNAEAQREKEKATAYTRNRLISGLRGALGLLARRAVGVWELMVEAAPCELEVSVEFGEYSNPSFEMIVETVGKAVGYGVMSVEKAVNEMYGDTLSEEEKREEVERIVGRS